jgi:hypothetical protein
MFIEKFVFLFGRIHPIWLRRKLFSFFHALFSVSKRFFRIVSEIRSPVFLVSGIGRTSKEPLQVLFIGRDVVPYFLFHELFDSDPDLEIKGRMWIWNCSKIKKECNSEVAGVLVSCDRFLHRFLHDDGWFVIPHWVSMCFDSSKNLNVLYDELPRSAKYDVKHVKKKDFSFSITTDLNKIRFFYDEMYLPLISSNVDEDEAYIADFLFFLLRLHKGYELLMIRDGKEEIAGVFFIQKHDMITLEYAGVHHGDNSLIKSGAFSAMYYFAIELAKKRGVKKIDFGGVKPFFDDGLFQYKRKWGMKVEPYSIVTDVTGFSMVKDNDDFKQFLLNNPFIGMDKKGRLVWYVFSGKKLNEVEKKEFEKELKVPGVEKVFFVEV